LIIQEDSVMRPGAAGDRLLISNEISQESL
jgi:hypothetical protein